MNKALTIKSAKTHMQRYRQPLLEPIAKVEIDPGYIITHRLPLEEAAPSYKIFRDEEDCNKVVLKPGISRSNGANRDGAAGAAPAERIPALS